MSQPRRQRPPVTSRRSCGTRRRVALAFVAGIACSLCALAGATGLPAFDLVGDETAIPDAVAGSLAQDADGRLWIGSSGGLISFDGYQFRRIVREPGDPNALPGSVIRSLLALSDGRIAVGTDRHGLGLLDTDSGRFQRPAGTAISGSIYALAEGPAGQLWVGSQGDGISRLDLHSGTLDSVPMTGLPSQEVNALLVDRVGDLWIGHDLGLARRSAADGSYVSIPLPVHSTAAGRSRVYALTQADDGTLWAGTHHGEVLRVDPTSMVATNVDASDQARVGGAESVFVLRQMPSGEIWVGRASGLELRAPSGQLLARVDDPRIVDVRAIMLDRSGLLWLTGFGTGLLRHFPAQDAVRVVSRLGTGRDESDANIAAVLETLDGEVWLAIRRSRLVVLDQKFDPLPAPAFEPADLASRVLRSLTALEQAAPDEFWLGSRDGLFRALREAPGVFRLSAVPGVATPYVRVVRKVGDEVWAGTDDGAFRVHRESLEATRIRAAGAALTGDVNAIALDADGRVLVGGRNGLFSSQEAGAHAERIGLVAGGGQQPSVVGMLVDRSGGIWVDTSEGLLHGTRHGNDLQFQPLNARLGLSAESLGANVLDDGAGRIWTPQYVIDPGSNTVYPLSAADGVRFGTSWFRAYARRANGDFLFGGSKGLLVIKPDQFRPWSFQPPVIATDVWIDGLPRAMQGDTLRLNPADRGFSIQFAALDLSDPGSLRYRYRLHGYETAWRPALPDSRIAAYSNLWPGAYRLEVEGTNRIGAWSGNRLELPVEIRPSFWQTGWFATFALLSFGGSVLLFIRLRTRMVQRRADRLKRMVEGRTRELKLAKDSAEEALVELRLTQRRLVDSEHLASLGRLVAGVSHEVNTPIGVALTAASHLVAVSREVDGKADSGQLRRSDFEEWREDIREGASLICGSLERASKLIASFKQVAADQSSEQRRRMDLARTLEEIRTAMQPAYRLGEHRVRIDCPEGIVMDSYPGALFQIVSNLVMNSVIHGFASRQRGEMRITARQSGDRVELTFRDNGHGMSDDVAAHAFEPFFSTRLGQGGSGLGLHLVHNLTCHVLGGEVQLESPPDGGTGFHFLLPLVAPEIGREA
ncbi:sensor histidine kinase [Pseudomarimonas salicorniae]|uniref:histidine kinase n=1 Tax=Pseudomarimonas salicorniae TaxID=2933270 RepID=A0ABT0GJ17_9GAMM|nr:sensor histidine kinase [Lysobacter sp. CAU 1642]MCK7594347.1 ATP-binding protein [Lysobacter sp. CAU 1642]